MEAGAGAGARQGSNWLGAGAAVEKPVVAHAHPAFDGTGRRTDAECEVEPQRQTQR